MTDDKESVISIRLPSGVVAELRARAHANGLPLSEIVREAIRNWLAAQSQFRHSEFRFVDRHGDQLSEQLWLEQRDSILAEIESIESTIGLLQHQLEPYVEAMAELRTRSEEQDREMSRLADEAATSRQELARGQSLISKLQAEYHALQNRRARLLRAAGTLDAARNRVVHDQGPYHMPEKGGDADTN